MARTSSGRKPRSEKAQLKSLLRLELGAHGEIRNRGYDQASGASLKETTERSAARALTEWYERQDRSDSSTAAPDTLTIAIGELVDWFKTTPLRNEVSLRLSNLEQRIASLEDRLGGPLERALTASEGSVSAALTPAKHTVEASVLATSVTEILQRAVGPQSFVSLRRHINDAGDEEQVLEAHYGFTDATVPEQLPELNSRVLKEYLTLPKGMRRGIVLVRLVR